MCVLNVQERVFCCWCICNIFDIYGWAWHFGKCMYSISARESNKISIHVSVLSGMLRPRGDYLSLEQLEENIVWLIQTSKIHCFNTSGIEALLCSSAAGKHSDSKKSLNLTQQLQYRLHKKEMFISELSKCWYACFCTFPSASYFSHKDTWSSFSYTVCVFIEISSYALQSYEFSPIFHKCRDVFCCH